MCTHKNLPTTSRLVRCPDCQAYFVIKSVNVIAASRGGYVGSCYEASPSDALGWTCGDSFTIPTATARKVV